MALTGRGALVAGLGVLAVLVLPALGWLLDGALVLAVLADVSLAAAVRDLRLHRSGATSARLNEPANLALRVANAGRRPARLVLRDAWPPSAGATPARHRLVVPPGEARVVTTTLTPSRRGDRHAAFVAVRSLGPLGLAGRQRRLTAPWAVRVVPAFPSRRHLPAKLARLRELGGAAVSLRRGQGSEFDALREYVAGDDARSIDWRGTARRGDVVVRTWRPERNRRIVVVVDTGRTSAARVGDAPRLEAALDAALLLTALAVRAGDTVDVLAHDTRLRAAVAGAGRRDLLGSVVAATASVEPVLAETDMRAVVAEVLRRTPRRALVVLLTALDAAPVAEGLLPALPALLSRHTVLVAAVADPALDALAAGRRDAAEVYAAAAAERALAERRRTASLLRRRGVEVVTAPPADLAPALADAYLSLKAAGRL
jgi:uncharacterized protein (DUF58 family)